MLQEFIYWPFDPIDTPCQVTDGLGWTIFILSILLIMKEATEAVGNLRKFFTSFDNLLDVALYTSSIIFTTECGMKTEKNDPNYLYVNSIKVISTLNASGRFSFFLRLRDLSLSEYLKPFKGNVECYLGSTWFHCVWARARRLNWGTGLKIAS